MKFSILILFSIYLVSCGDSKKDENQRPDGLIRYTLNLDQNGTPEVSDGDTFEVVDPDPESQDKQINKIRILGIDTPEKGRIKGMEPYGLAATRFLEKTLFGLKEIEALHWNEGKALGDPFGRILAEPYVRNSYPSRELLKNGLAVSCFFSNSIQLNSILIPIQTQSIKSKLGIWSLLEGSHPDSLLLLERIVKNCDGILGGMNLNLMKASQLEELPGFTKEIALKLVSILGEIKSWNELEVLLEKESLFSSSIVESLKSLYQNGLFVIRDKNFGYGPAEGIGRLN